MTHGTDSTESRRLLSPAASSALAGGLLVGLSAAVIAFVFIGPLRGYGFDFGDTLLVGLLGGLFGVVAGAVAGASEADDHVPTAAPSRAVKVAANPPSSLHPAHRGV